MEVVEHQQKIMARELRVRKRTVLMNVMIFAMRLPIVNILNMIQAQASYVIYTIAT